MFFTMGTENFIRYMRLSDITESDIRVLLKNGNNSNPSHSDTLNRPPYILHNGVTTEAQTTSGAVGAKMGLEERGVKIAPKSKKSNIVCRML